MALGTAATLAMLDRLHVLAADGAFPPDGGFVTVLAVPGTLFG